MFFCAYVCFLWITLTIISEKFLDQLKDGLYATFYKWGPLCYDVRIQPSDWFSLYHPNYTYITLFSTGCHPNYMYLTLFSTGYHPDLLPRGAIQEHLFMSSLLSFNLNYSFEFVPFWSKARMDRQALANVMLLTYIMHVFHRYYVTIQGRSCHYEWVCLHDKNESWVF